MSFNFSSWQTVSGSRYYLPLFLILALIGLVGYGLTLNVFFTGDDFFLLREAKSGWMVFNRADFAFYRPFTMLIWFSEYHLWHLQPLFYHLVNLFFHILNSFLVAIMLNQLTGNRSYGRWAGILFCLYPVHPEAVSWLAGSFDVLSTTGQLLSIIFLLKFFRNIQHSRRVSASIWLMLSLIAYLFALLNKEEALFIPMIVATYVCCEMKPRKYKLAQKILWVVGVTAFYLLITLFYLALRSLVLGNINSSDQIDYNYPAFIIAATAQAYELLIAPINSVLLAGYKSLALLLILLCNLLFGLALIYVFVKTILHKNFRLVLTLGFGLVWSIVAIEPALAVNYIRAGWKSGDLEGSRVLYSASVGICVILAVTVVELKDSLKRLQVISLIKRLGLLPGLAIATFFLLLLNLNNNAWISAGRQTQEIAQEFRQVVQTAKQSGHDLTQLQVGVGIVLVDLPDNYAGAYVAHNMFIYQNNFGQVFYNLAVPASQVSSDQEKTLDYSKLDFKTLYIAKFKLIDKDVKLISIAKLDKSSKPIELLNIQS